MKHRDAVTHLQTGKKQLALGSVEATASMAGQKQIIGKSTAFNKWCCNHWTPTGKTMNLDRHLMPFTELTQNASRT